MDDLDQIPPWEDKPELDLRTFISLTAVTDRLVFINTEYIVCYTEAFDEIGKFIGTVIRLTTEEDLTVKNRINEITAKLKDLGLV